MRNKIISILTEIRPEFDFNDDTNFIEEGMLDSFDIVTLVASLESEFGIKISGINIIPENFDSVNSIAQLIKKSQA